MRFCSTFDRFNSSTRKCSQKSLFFHQNLFKFSSSFQSLNLVNVLESFFEGKFCSKKNNDILMRWQGFSLRFNFLRVLLLGFCCLGAFRRISCFICKALKRRFSWNFSRVSWGKFLLLRINFLSVMIQMSHPN